MLDSGIVDSVVRSVVGPGTEFWRYDGRGNSAMGVALTVAEEAIQHPFEVYWVRKGGPENFSFPAFVPAVIVFSERYLELSTHLTWLRQDRQLQGPMKLELYRRSCMKILAELTLMNGDPGRACRLLVDSIVGEVASFIPTSAIDADMADIDERYLASWLFPLLHEVSHVALENQVTDPGVLADLASLVDQIASQTFPDGSADALRAGLDTGTGATARGALITEIQADVVASRMLRHAAGRLMGQVNLGELALQILASFRSLEYLNLCILAAHAVDIDSFLAPASAFGTATHIRANALLEFMAGDLVTSGVVPLDSYQDLRVTLAEQHANRDPHAEYFTEGLQQALTQSFALTWADDSDLGELDQFFARNPMARLMHSTEIKAFVSLAQALGVHHPRLDHLSRLTSSARQH